MLCGLLFRRYSYPTAVYTLKDIENRHVVQTEGCTKFGLLLQNVSCPLAVKLVDLVNNSMEVVSAGVVHIMLVNTR